MAVVDMAADIVAAANHTVAGRVVVGRMAAADTTADTAVDIARPDFK